MICSAFLSAHSTLACTEILILTNPGVLWQVPRYPRLESRYLRWEVLWITDWQTYYSYSYSWSHLLVCCHRHYCSPPQSQYSIPSIFCPCLKNYRKTPWWWNPFPKVVVNCRIDVRSSGPPKWYSFRSISGPRRVVKFDYLRHPILLW